MTLPRHSPLKPWLSLLVGSMAWCAASSPTAGQETANVWKNTRPGVQYIGTAQCVQCHRDQHQSYLKTTHSVATTETDAADEPAEATLQHPILEPRYQVEHQGESMFHRRVVSDAAGRPFVTESKKITYSVGSGQHAKSYLFQEGDFLGQSPLTWYEEPDAWRMSPGFEGPTHPAFHRKIEFECVFCHVGSIDRRDHNPYQFDITETTIGCERCHGPGELHAAKYRENPDATGDDYTIVNPDRLSRELSEAVCQQCHLQGVSWITTTGREVWDYRPGLPLTDFRVDYQFSLGGDDMRIVGHVEQMHASECYKQTETMTCTTCHDPHNPVPREERAASYRQTCLDCHQEESCGTSHDDRMRLADNDCAKCHMPKADTNVTHAAFHNHKIGVYPEATAESKPQRIALTSILDVSRLPQRERDRCLALAKVLLLRGQPGNPDYSDLGFEASETLIRLKNAGPTDAESDCRLALLAIAQNQREIAENLARETIAKEPRPTLAHIEAVSLLGRLAFQDQKPAEAVEFYRKVNQYHRDPDDAYYLGLCESNVGNTEAAITALQRSLEIHPLQVGPHQALEVIYQSLDRPEKAKAHARQRQNVIDFWDRQRARVDDARRKQGR